MPCYKNTIKYSKTVFKTWYNRVYSCIVRALCLLVNLPLGQSSVHSKKHCLRLCTLDCSTLSLTCALDGDGRLTPRPGRFISGKETRYPPCRRTGGPQGRSGRARKISPSSGFDRRTFQPVANRNTDCYPGPLMHGMKHIIFPDLFKSVIMSFLADPCLLNSHGIVTRQRA
jgi:hypothetical protein